MSFKIKANSFVKLAIIISFSMYLLSFIIVQLIIDPYRELQFFDFEINKKSFSTSKTTPYLLSRELLNDRFTIVFGTSRSARINKSMAGDKVINFSSSLYGNPIDVYNFLINLDKRKIKNINQVYYSIDPFTFGNKDSYYKDKVYSNNLFNKIYNSLKSFTIASIKNAYKSILMNLNEVNSYLLKNDGTIEHLNAKNNSVTDNKIQNIGYPKPIKFGKKAFSSLSKIDIFLKKHKIKIIYFSAPLYDKYIEKMNMDQVIRHAKEITKNIDYFYDLRCFPYVSEFYNKFSSPVHPKSETLKSVLSNIPNDFKVNKNNVDFFYIDKWSMCNK